MAGIYEARYYSPCAACDDEIRPGDMATWSDDLAVHEACQFAPIINRTSSSRVVRDPCPKCWTIPAANGACGCEED